ncbi:MAG: aspartate--tRNA ligase [Spirochaetia bacterium]
MKRTATCGSLSLEQKDETVILNGWVHRNRDHGGIHFVNLRDRYGVTQVVIDANTYPELRDAAESLKFEYCVAIEGIVRQRPEDMRNPDMTTGDIEIEAKKIQVLSKSTVLPFMIDERSDAKEDLRLQYRYLDLRSFSMQEKIALRHKVMLAVRNYLSNQGFLEIETPTLIRSTPEGARDFLVPSRHKTGSFYALPQSPQLFKQILMASGFDKYFQLAHCFRDEDARGDRQPEHTQIDMEMSFVSKEEVFSITEGMMKTLFQQTLGIDIQTPFQRLSYDDAMNRYGSDKPDLRFGLEIQDFAEFVPGSSFKVFKSVLESGGAVKALVAKGCAGFSRKMITAMEDVAKLYGAKGLAWMKVTETGLDGGISKFFIEQDSAIRENLSAEVGDLILFVADKWQKACVSLGAVRNRLAKDMDLHGSVDFRFSWIVDFPLFEWDEDNEKWEAAHHMFTMPQAQYLNSMEDDPGAVKGDLYDLVCNGLELASGSIRVHDPEIQKRIFNIVGFSEEEAEKRFGFLLKAFQYGAPPHGGIAPGLDRLLMLMTGEETIREVMAFPKNTQGISPMDEAPSTEIDPKQLEELNLKVIKKKEEDA